MPMIPHFLEGAQVQGDYSLGELAVRFGLGLRGEPDLRVSRVGTLSHAGRGALSFLANPRYRRQMQSTHATAVLVAAEHVVDCPVAALIDPRLLVEVEAVAYKPGIGAAGAPAPAADAPGERPAAAPGLGWP